MLTDQAIFSAKRIIWLTFAVIIGSILYRFFIAIALNNETLNGIGFGPQDLNLITALLVVGVLAVPKFKHQFAKRGK